LRFLSDHRRSCGDVVHHNRQTADLRTVAYVHWSEDLGIRADLDIVANDWARPPRNAVAYGDPVYQRAIPPDDGGAIDHYLPAMEDSQPTADRCLARQGYAAPTLDHWMDNPVCNIS
jgi:hypothetical protein